MALDQQAMALEIEGSLRLFGGVRRLLRAVRKDSPEGTRTGLAPTALGACLLARRGPGVRHVLHLRTLARHLDTLPCTALPAAQAHLDSLQALGCRHLGGLRALPRIGLLNRGYADLILSLDQAYGQAPPRAHHWLADRDDFILACEPDCHSVSAQAIQAACTPLLEALCAWLDVRQAATSTLTLNLAHDTRRPGPPATRICLRAASPQWGITHFARLLREHLARQQLAAPVVRIVLQCHHIQPRTPHTTTLLFDDSPSVGRESTLFDILRARLGPDCLHFPHPLVQHLPDHTDRWLSAPSAPGQAPLPRLSRHSRPLWLLAHAATLPAPGHRPLLHGAPLALISGPERIQGGWWIQDGTPINRDYFIARDARGARYWIYRDLPSGGWFLHGLFG